MPQHSASPNNLETPFCSRTGLQTRRGGIAWFFRKHRGEAFATARVMAGMTRPFVAAIESFAETNPIPLISIERGQ